ncbi:MAG TPA: flagellar biosynthesis anti-sigma factor FlgM [Burkholderiales bacterium]|nr:flagellar biosynthesis anti-sigma factor FlgM [Pseudomonadota bacterium]HVC48705.1 flagellar biosynthesis anti-sigma factor FlgM [Burkholderiales bacterium]
MKIDRPVRTGTLNTVVTSNGNASSRSGTSTPSPAATSDQVSLTQSGNHIRQLETVLAGTDIASAERISAIKQAITEGRFQIKPEAIASGLIASVKALLQEKK